MGIEPTALAWEARVLPLYDARFGGMEAHYTSSRQRVSRLHLVRGVIQTDAR